MWKQATFLPRLVVAVVILTITFGLQISQTGQAQPAVDPTDPRYHALLQGRFLPVEANPTAGQQPPATEFPARSQTQMTVEGSVAFSSNRPGQHDIYAQNADGSGSATLLTTSPNDDFTPSWSPDGTKLLFVTNRTGNYEIYVRQENGQEQNLTNHGSDDAHPAWSPDGQKIIFTSNRNGYFQIFSIQSNGSGLTQLTNIAGNNAMYPRYPPNGSQIAYMRASTTAIVCEWNWDVWVMNANGTNQQRVTSQLAADIYPNWTPDNKITYASCRNYLDLNLYKVNPDGTGEQQLTNWFLTNEWAAVYSPNGTHVAFNSDSPGNSEIYITDAANWGSADNLTQHAAEELAPSWRSQEVAPPPCGTGNPIMIITGWQGSLNPGSSLEIDPHLRYLADWLEPLGYRNDCDNLFYALNTSPYLNLDENALIIQNELRTAASQYSQRYPTSSKVFIIIGYSYGGLRARAYLESDLYSQEDCPNNSPTYVCVDNLFTLGTPHLGEVGILPFDAYILLSAILGQQWTAIAELLPNERIAYNLSHSQPNNVCYRLIGGDGRDQAAFLPTLLLPVYYKWPPSQWLPNDFAVHQISAHGLLPFFNHYSNVTYIFTPDLHGQVPSLIDPLGLLRSYANPQQTFLDHIEPWLGESACPPLVIERDSTVNPLTLLKQPAVQSAIPMPMMDIASGELTGSNSVSGQFSMNSTDPSQITLYWSSGNIEFTLTDPNGYVITPQNSGSNPNIDYLNLEIGYGLMASYQITSTVPGFWEYNITPNNLPDPAPYRLVSFLAKPISVNGFAPGWSPYNESVVITATVSYSSTTLLPGGNVTAEILRPAGNSQTVPLFDDGAHNDGAANDGLYGLIYSETDSDGIYIVRLASDGTHNGQEYTRNNTVFFTVGSNAASLNDTYSDVALDQNGDGLYEWLELSIGLDVLQAGEYAISADLYAGNEFISHAIGQLSLATGSQTLLIRFDGDDIRQSQLNGPYMIRNLLLFHESNDGLLIETADNVHTTAPYSYEQFGRTHRQHLPIVRRS
jgi:hypothetical protein